MAASFKLPCLVEKRKPPVNFPLFEWRDISIKEQLGSGTFGSVYRVNYEKDEQNAILKKMKGESAEAKRRFGKEAAIFNTVKGHRNVCEFLKFCQEPYAIMMEYSCFDFNFLEVDKKVSSLEDSIHFIDAEFEFESFSDASSRCVVVMLKRC